MTICIHLDPKLADGLEQEAALMNLTVDKLVEEALVLFLTLRCERSLSSILGSPHTERIIQF